MVFGIGLMLLLIEIMLIPAQKKRSNFITRLSIGIVGIMGLNILESIILYLFKIRALFVSMSIINFILIVALLFYLMKKRCIQKYEIKIIDAIYITTLILIICVIAFINFGGIPFKIKYQTTDASVHFALASNVIKEESLLLKNNSDIANYYDFNLKHIGAYINEGIFFKMFEGNIHNDIDAYKLYILFDMFMLFISGLVMYSVISEIKSDKKSIRYLAFTISILYILAYPLNSILMGSAYQTLVLIFSSSIILIWNKKEELPDIYFKLILFLLNIGVLHCYMILGVIVLLAEAVMYMISEKKKAIKNILILIILPIATLLIYDLVHNIISGIVEILLNRNIAEFKEVGFEVEGTMYKNYYSNFLLYIPFIIYEIFAKLKKKEKIDLEIVLICTLVFVLPILYTLKSKGIISSYYYMKLYYLLWIPTLVLFTRGICRMWNKKGCIACITIAILVTLFIASYVTDNTQYTEEEAMQDMSKENITKVAQIYKLNIKAIKSQKKILNTEEIEVIKRAREAIELKENNLEVIGGMGQINWVYSMYEYTNAEKNDEGIMSKLYDVENINTEYVLVFKRSKIWKEIKEKLVEKYYFIYETEWGGILKLIKAPVEGRIYDGVPIPKDFEYVIGDKATGLVIRSSIDGNEFVWVPCTLKISSLMQSKYEKWTNTETSAIRHEETIDDDLPDGVLNEIDQILNYGGFYIARYEAGIPKELGKNALTKANSTNRNKSGYAPVSKKNQVPWNYINYYNAKKNAELMYSNDYIQSGLITGTQYDTVMKWLENSGYNVQTDSGNWGNYRDVLIEDVSKHSADNGATWISETSKPLDKNRLLKTGHSDYTRANNIYDLAGNLWEWTSEIYNQYNVNRGGYSVGESKESPAAHRNYDERNISLSGISSCIVYQIVLLEYKRLKKK